MAVSKTTLHRFGVAAFPDDVGGGAYRVARVEQNGDNATASLGGSPYATAQAAYNAIAAAPAGIYRLQLGLGAWSIVLTADWNQRVAMVCGAGHFSNGSNSSSCQLQVFAAGADGAPGINGGNGRNVIFASDKTVLIYVDAKGGAGGDAENENESAADGGAGGNVDLRNAFVSSVVVDGGSGGQTDGTGGTESWGGRAGQIILRNCLGQDPGIPSEAYAIGGACGYAYGGGSGNAGEIILMNCIGVDAYAYAQYGNTEQGTEGLISATDCSLDMVFAHNGARITGSYIELTNTAYGNAVAETINDYGVSNLTSNRKKYI